MARQGVGSMGRRVQDIALALTECEKLTLRKSTSFDRYQYIASCCTLQSRTKRDLEKPVLDLESLLPITYGQFTCWQFSGDGSLGFFLAERRFGHRRADPRCVRLHFLRHPLHGVSGRLSQAGGSQRSMRIGLGFLHLG